ncbi:hypothetical protein ADL26_02895 [Thermoactinomyces vulgaris]|jgi:hypothetical protein|nr:hypothetical protein ADL26_02895 [Thermoactinomyces vulgaris]
MEKVLHRWKKVMTECGFAVGPTDEHVMKEIQRSLDPGEKLLKWYKDYAPRMGELDFGGNPIQLYEPEEMIEVQVNFSHDLASMQSNPEWRNDWIVIADKGLDPFILDKKEGNLYHAWHGQVSINLREIAPSLDGFIETLTVLCEVCYLKYEGQFLNDEWEFDKKILREIENRLRAILPYDSVENWISMLE